MNWNKAHGVKWAAVPRLPTAGVRWDNGPNVRKDLSRCLLHFVYMCMRLFCDNRNMPRTYKRKTDHGLVPHVAMLEAVELVVINGLSVRKVAKDKGLSKSVLA